MTILYIIASVWCGLIIARLIFPEEEYGRTTKSK